MSLPKIKITAPKLPGARRKPTVGGEIAPKESKSKSKPTPQKHQSSHRRPSFDIAKNYVEMNFAVLMTPELSPKDAKKAARAEKKAAARENRKKHHVRNALLSLLGLAIIAAAIGGFWWTTSLQPVNKDDAQTRQFIVAKGASTDEIATALQKSGFIRNATAFKIYVRLNDKMVQAGTHLLSPSYSMSEIADRLARAVASEIDVQIPPGLTLRQLRNTWKKYDYTDAEIDAAYAATYENAILNNRPDGATLEGFIFPETYRVYSNASLESIIQMAINQFEKVAAANDLSAKFAARGLKFYDGLTLASIIEKEVPSEADRKLVAGVFFNRISNDMSLDADATYKYAYAEKFCTIDGPSCDSIYNTRKFTGLPPGPISNVDLAALMAVAEPTDSGYFYYVTGDDGKNHFSETNDEHEANVAAYCHVLCQ